MELHAPSRWRCVDCISDLHLQMAEPQTFTAWQRYLQTSVADAVFLLGDIFEVWVGDDVLTQRDGFEYQCAEALRAASARMDVHIMRGNRDFLMGPALAAASNSTLLEDPTVLVFAGTRWLLTHGDALCLDDTDYMQFRAKVRSPQWQATFLKQPLPDRLAVALSLRAQSEARKRSETVYADVDFTATTALLKIHGADHMIHGHTHKPATHALDAGRERMVLSDWDIGARPPKADILRLRSCTNGSHGSFTVERIPPSMAGGHHAV